MKIIELERENLNNKDKNPLYEFGVYTADFVIY